MEALWLKGSKISPVAVVVVPRLRLWPCSMG